MSISRIRSHPMIQATISPHGGVREGVGGPGDRNHRGELGVAHDGGHRRPLRPMMKLMMTARTGMERRGLRADGEDARTDRHGHAHDGQVPPFQITFKLMTFLAGFGDGLLDGFGTE